MRKITSRFKLLSILGISLLTSIVFLSGISSTNKQAEPVSAGTAETETEITIMVDTKDWGGIHYIHYWGGSGATTKPVNMTQIGNTTVWYKTISTSHTNFLLAENENWQNQTKNLSVPNADSDWNCIFVYWNESQQADPGWYTGFYYNVKYEGNGGNHSGSTSSTQTVYTDNMGTYASNYYTRTGYTFKEWNTKADGTGTSYAAGTHYEHKNELTRILNKTVTLYAIWEAQTVSVTLDQQSGSGGSTSVTAAYGSPMPTATMPTRAGWTFGGYYTGTGGSGTKYYNADGSSAKNWDKTSATTLYAYWTARTDTGYKVKHYKQTTALGSNYELAETENKTGTTGANTAATAKSYTGFTNKSFSQKTISGDGSTVVEIYYDRNALIVTYDSDGGSIVSPQTVYYGCTIGTLPTEPAKDGFTFSGWYTQKDGGGTQITGSTVITENITVYAKWITSVTYINMTFYPGDHSTQSGSQVKQAIKGESYEIPGALFTAATGYVFKSWLGSDNVEYSPGDTIDDVEEAMSFTAQYQLKYYGMAGSTRFELSFDGTNYTATGVSFSKGDELQLFDISSGSPTKVTPMGIDANSRGVWKDEKEGTELLCDEDNRTSFNLSLPNGGDHWLTTYTTDPGEKISAYVNGYRATMISKDEDMQEGVDHQWYAEFTNTHVGDKISFQTNYTQTTKISYTKDRNSNQYIDANGGLRISGNVKVWLKHHTDGTYTSYITGMANSGFHFIADWTNGDYKYATFSEEITYDQDIWQYDKLYHQYKLVYSVEAGQTISAYNGGTDAYFNFGKIEWASSLSGKFTNSGGDLVCNTGSTGTYVFYLKCEDGSTYNELYIAEASAEQFAIDFAKAFNTAISAECHMEGWHEDTLKTAWDAQSVKFTNMCAQYPDAKGYFTGAKSSSDANIINCLEKYDYVFTKYYGIIFTEVSDDFMERFRKSDNHNAINLPANLNRNYTLTQSEDQTVLIIVLASSGILALSASALLLFLRKRKNEVQ